MYDMIKNCIKLDVNNVMIFEIIFTKTQMYKYCFVLITINYKIYTIQFKIQYNKIQYNIIQYNTIQYNTIIQSKHKNFTFYISWKMR